MAQRNYIAGLILLLLTFVIGGSAHAQCSPGIPCTAADGLNPGTGMNDEKAEDLESCDGDFMNQIYAKAYLEAEREVVVNEAIIRKPDSVMEYTCFDEFVSVVAHESGDIFSDTTEWQARIVDISGTLVPWVTPMSTWMFDVRVVGCGGLSLGGDKLDASLECMVLNGLEDYIDDNFDHAFLGGSAGIDSNVSNSIGGSNYTCTWMQEVWNIAKCEDFGSEVGFLTFDEIRANDPRQLPSACGGTGITQDIIDVANNDGWGAVELVALETYSMLMRPPGGPVNCGTPIPTGVVITRYEWDPNFIGETDRDVFTHNEHVCSNPSCFYERVSNSCLP